jgi:hypothetical protein
MDKKITAALSTVAVVLLAIGGWFFLTRKPAPRPVASPARPPAANVSNNAAAYAAVGVQALKTVGDVATQLLSSDEE